MLLGEANIPPGQPVNLTAKCPSCGALVAKLTDIPYNTRMLDILCVSLVKESEEKQTRGPHCTEQPLQFFVAPRDNDDDNDNDNQDNQEEATEATTLDWKDVCDQLEMQLGEYAGVYQTIRQQRTSKYN